MGVCFAQVDILTGDAACQQALRVDLDAQTITQADDTSVVFPMCHRRHYVKNGQDDVALTLQLAAEIEAFEAAISGRAKGMPWL